MNIALDAFGSDHAPSPEIEGVVMALKENCCRKILLVGNPDVLNRELDKYLFPRDRVEIIPSSEVIRMDEKATVRKPDSSISVAMQLVKTGRADAVVSAGNTGAVMTGAMTTLGWIRHVIRPAIAISMPTMKRPTIFLDAGANVDCSPENLVQFARLGSLYSRFFFRIDRPEIALLNIGEESGKGNELAKKSHALLTEQTDLHFIGNIEGKYLLDGVVDVIVCDGFVGNVMLKTVEGVAMSFFRVIKEQMKNDWVARIGALLSYPVYHYLRRKWDHSETGGALLVGMNGIVVIAHGSSNAKSIKNAIRFAAKVAESGFLQHAISEFDIRKPESVAS
jgi:glycerol-3-phosphate acyltransferase PlsX